MGSWNGTCGLTQLPIKDGDEVVVILLEKRTDKVEPGGGYCYSNHFFTPCSLPLFGIYDDYGSVENVKGNVEEVFRHFKKRFEHEKYMIAEGEKPKNIEEFIRVVERGYVEKMGFMMILKPVYEKVINEIGSRKKYKGTKKLKEETLDEVKEYIKRAKQLKDSNEYFSQSELQYLNSFTQFYLGFDVKMKAFLNILTNDEKIEIINDLVDIYLLSIAMTLTRKMWLPQAGAGSQVQEMYLHKIIAEEMIRIEKERVDEYLKENEYDGEISEITKETLF
jgi:hypothetical protein